jgi:hypothetical protein
MAKTFEKVFIYFIALTHVYFVFRYPLKYGSATSSGSYSSTPLVLQVGKYVAVLLLEGVLVTYYLLRPVKVKLNSNQKVFIALVGALTIYTTAAALLNIGQGVNKISTSIELSFFLPIFIFFAVFCRHNIKKYSNVIILSYLYHLVYSTIQIVLYATIGRLPNIAYAGGLARFGGGWDAPNAFGMFVLLPLFVAWSLRSGRQHSTTWRVLHTVTLLTAPVLVFLTLSLTSFAVLFGGAGLYLVLSRRWKALLALFSSVIAGVVFVILTPLYDLVLFFIEAKSASIEAHQESLKLGKYVGDHNVFELLGGGVGSHLFSESTYVYALSNFGVFGLGLLLAIIGISLVLGILKVNKARKHSRWRSDLFAAYVAYVGAFAVGAINLPFFSIFPTNVYFWFAVVMIWFLPTVRSPSAHRDRSVSIASPG